MNPHYLHFSIAKFSTMLGRNTADVGCQYPDSRSDRDLKI